MPSSTIDVQQTLDSVNSQFKSSVVEKPIPIEIDIGNLVAYDLNAITENQDLKPTDEQVKETSRDATQLIINKLFKLQRRSDTNGVYATLPKGTSLLPRGKPIPKEKALTKWERFAKLKGINNKKKSRKIFDEEKKEWTHRKN